MESMPKSVIRAAEARAQGWSWTTAAKEAGWTLHGLRQWIRQHESSWFRELYRARREAHAAACDEAIAILRQQLRSTEDKTTFQAASTLATKLPTRKPKPPAPNMSAEDAQMLDEYKTLLTDLSEPDEVAAPVTTEVNPDMERFMP